MPLNAARSARQTEGMENMSAQELHEKWLHKNWQRAVIEHATKVREARCQGATPNELQRLSRSCLAKVDAAFTQLKAAEAKRKGTTANTTAA